MTAPDHRPFLADTDLRTAEDVAAWLRGPAWRDAALPLAHVSLGYVTQVLDARLDRERRQACRRGARYEITMARGFRGRGGKATTIGTILERAHVERALAFRAAARQP